MAEGTLFSIAGKVIEILGGLAAQEVTLCWGVKDQLMKLEDTLTRIKAVILDAEEKAQKQNNQIKVWLKKLGRFVYDAEDLLDNFTTEIQKKQLMPGNKFWREVRVFFSESNQCVYGLRMGHEVKTLLERIDAIDADVKQLNLDSLDDKTDFLTSSWRQTTSSEPEVIVGREGDKSAVKKFLLNSNYEENVSVVSIVGMSGFGKTTLAQHFFNDEEVKAHFGEKRLWLSVSGVLEVGKILKGVVKDFDQLEKILKGVVGKDVQLERLKNEFEKEIGKKKYLLVLDDVWDAKDGGDGEKWDNLKQWLPRDAVGSKIMVTTRSHVIANFTSTIAPRVLGGLSPDDSWDLFRKAFRQDEQSGHVDDKIRKEIVERCCGVPLVIKTIARLMSLKDRALWSSFIRNELPYRIIDENIVQTFMLSYNALPSYMKPCFAYCSLFPKGHRIDVKSLFQLWIAQGFIRSSNSVDSGESVALMCFESLLWSSFFQDVEKDDLGNIKSCRLHDFMHDLAAHVAGLESTNVEDFGGNRISDLTRHVSFVMELDLLQQIRILLPCAKRLRTLILKGGKWDERAWEYICRKFGHLRVLVLHKLGIEEVSPLIENLKHLKYLDLSYNQMEELPNSITNLVNLQVLKLNGCEELKRLPRDMSKLINLRHLDVGCSLADDLCGLEYMPRGIGQLTSLQTLSCFVVAKNSSHKSKMVGGLDELNRLNELRGSLEIIVVEYDSNSWISECKGAKLIDKQHLQSLTIRWRGPERDSNSDINLNDETLQNLQPNLNLQELKVVRYGGMRFPSWLSRLSNLVGIHLEDCPRLEHIPPLHGILSLEALFIDDMRSLEYIDSEGVGGKGVSTFFPSLKKLELGFCGSLKGWWKKSSDEINDDSDEIMLCFPSLSSLKIGWCPNLTSMPLFPTLDILDLRCTSSMPLQQTMKMTAPVSSSSSSSIDTFIRPLSKLKELLIFSVEDMESLPEIGLQNLSSLQQLVIILCSRLKSLPLPDEGMPSLQILNICVCKELKSLSQSESQGVIPYLSSLEHLRISSVTEELSGRIRGWGKESVEEWPIIEHIPNIVIDEYYIQKDGRYVKEDEITY
ncbi:putative disease resistance protein RGA4 [Diospyros lotus]|uniref:putative disease resistance protein RGA4 n=1 Tax=Diospyros lotus TaxID=55363 RepID=UPI00224F7C11|nr:putative disease resistance protein RGA4 [Diospyros lotus]XP_052203911.1 putative disease resistance protein RGA4 [Diospyros lotus]XP_052203912.1 putative disease resistance protein RGA4 [Diospyros lotus]XP_052203913.1 putative disease resistance protein RGA4 [Diospyros lotus]